MLTVQLMEFENVFEHLNFKSRVWKWNLTKTETFLKTHFPGVFYCNRTAAQLHKWFVFCPKASSGATEHHLRYKRSSKTFQDVFTRFLGVLYKSLKCRTYNLLHLQLSAPQAGNCRGGGGGGEGGKSQLWSQPLWTLQNNCSKHKLGCLKSIMCCRPCLICSSRRRSWESAGQWWSKRPCTHTSKTPTLLQDFLILTHFWS